MTKKSLLLGTALLLSAASLAGAASAAGAAGVSGAARSAPIAAMNVVAKDGAFTEASAERLADGRIAIHWKTSAGLGPAKVYWSSSPDGDWRELARTYAMFGGYVAADPNPGSRTYFKVKGGNGDAIVTAERRLKLEGAINFRDLGGYETADGKTVKWGKLFRSEELAGLTAADIAFLQKSGLKTDVDYRTSDEVKAKPDPEIAGVAYVADPVFQESGNGADLYTYLAKGEFDKLGKPGDLLVQANRDMIDHPDAYAKLFELLLDPANTALVQHCTAGKDRAGLGSALVLLALGVPKDTVVQDYLLSNAYRAEANKAAVDAMVSQMKLTDENAIEFVQALMDVRSEYIEAAFDEMDAKYGSVDAFLEKGLGLTSADRAKLKSMYLE